MESPGMAKRRRASVTDARARRIVHGKAALSVVSMTVMSRMAMSKSSPEASTAFSFTSISPRSRSSCRVKLSKVPCKAIVAMRSLELICASSRVMASTPTRFLSIVVRSRSTNASRAATRVSPSASVTTNPCRLRSSGKDRRRRSKEIFIPVVSEAYAATRCTAKSCTGGR